MRALSLAVALASLVIAPQAADAQCGGDGGSSGSGSGGSGGGDSDSEPACEEVSPVVGHAVCTRFGRWDAGRRPAIRFAGGASLIRIPVGDLALSGAAAHADAPSMSYAVVGSDRSATGGAFDLGVTAALGRHLYVGIDGSIGALESGPMSVSSATAELGVETRSLVYLAGAAVAGAQVDLGALQLRGEVGVGVRAVGATVETNHADCVLSDTHYDAAPLIRPRLSAQRWVTPWVSVGASAGTNLARRGETSFGLFVGGHLRAFDAGR